MNHDAIIRAFGFEIESDIAPERIYAYAPVFRVANADGFWVVKRTQTPLLRAQAIASWTNSLAALGISVVVPAVGFGDNPRVFQDDEGQEVEKSFIRRPGHFCVTQLNAKGLDE